MAWMAYLTDFQLLGSNLLQRGLALGTAALARFFLVLARRVRY
jgi:hypothetical protein